jgi:hypothetical protein
MPRKTPIYIAKATVPEKKCSKCGVVKPAAAFSRHIRRPSGLASACRECCNAARKYRYRPHPKRTAEQLERDRVLRFLKEQGIKTTPGRVRTSKQRRDELALYRNRALRPSEWHKPKITEIDPPYTAEGLAEALGAISEFYTWQGMFQRCYRTTHPKFKHYGGRGISVCERWRAGDSANRILSGKTVEGFMRFIADMRMRPPGLTLDRIDNNGNYEPGNCRWVTYVEQNRNKRKRTPPPSGVLPDVLSSGRSAPGISLNLYKFNRLFHST